jgi:hypothetical protein
MGWDLMRRAKSVRSRRDTRLIYIDLSAGRSFALRFAPAHP